MSRSDYQPLHASTGEVGEADRIDFWVGHVCGNHGEMGFEFGDRRGFAGTTRVQRLGDARLGDFQLVEFSSTDIRYARTARHIRRDDDRSARLVIALEGGIGLSQCDDAVWLRPGQMGMVTMGLPMALTHGDFARAWILTVPAEDLPASCRDRPPLALDSERALLGTVAAMTGQLAACRETMSTWEFVQISSRLVELLGMSLDDDRAPAESRYAAIARDARLYVEKYSDDASVTVDSIADHLGCSRRMLEAALRSVRISPARLLRETRLRRARQRLQDRFRADSVSAVAFASGFGSISAFNEAFLREYGVPPGQFRHHALRCS
ncbi:AraC-like DNA-binding protein [Nocardia transvalensis]|uniref:AraC-like DNA-binding protein n=1 Tax=Nocardia transvalensis TaxID=37333 RepID=A0A7W9UKQ4_9NOCA|nr:helix-turn-helix domain-containing protein [Nocardia transvalensis]MBB5916547.1 AraC-like DNA-binding protein [Nocardia transvalensis]